MRKPRLAMVLLGMALFITLFICHVSNRLLGASENWVVFNCGDEEPTFSTLIRYAAFLSVPASAYSCVNNLRQIDGATQQWAIEHKKSADAKVTLKDIREYVKSEPRCPHGGAYLLVTVKDSPKCTVPGHFLPEPVAMP